VVAHPEYILFGSALSVHVVTSVDCAAAHRRDQTADIITHQQQNLFNSSMQLFQGRDLVCEHLCKVSLELHEDVKQDKCQSTSN